VPIVEENVELSKTDAEKVNIDGITVKRETIL